MLKLFKNRSKTTSKLFKFHMKRQILQPFSKQIRYTCISKRYLHVWLTPSPTKLKHRWTLKQGLVVPWPPHAVPVELIGTGSGSISMDTRISTIGRALSNTTSSDLYAPTAKSTGRTEISHMFKSCGKAADTVFFKCYCFLSLALFDYKIEY